VSFISFAGLVRKGHRRVDGSLFALCFRGSVGIRSC